MIVKQRHQQNKLIPTFQYQQHQPKSVPKKNDIRFSLLRRPLVIDKEVMNIT